MLPSVVDKVFLWSAKNKVFVIRIFQFFWSGLIIYSYIGARSIYYQDANFLHYYSTGITAGQISIIFFIIALLPGITNRFGIRHKLLAVVMFFRRHIGITMYLFALIHFSFLKLIPWISSGKFILPTGFELYGFLAHIFLIFLFVTSNDFSQNRLNIWWYRIHRLIYLIMWLIFLHVALQRWSTWSILMGIVVFIQMTSFIYAKKQTGKFLPH